ncbi:MAG: enoyl-CoA hydratase/isomerase family protein [Gemmatimonadota bacterium]|nr:MAG: enoyl-CoA hydratase/isomerase family protein [Gemmatimonadota bacterium]
MAEKKEYETILYTVEDLVARVTLNRPEIRNAFNDVMIGELLEVFDNIAGRDDVRVVVLTGRGTCYCAGADLHWMKRIQGYSYQENFEDTLRLAELMYSMYSSPKPTIARINGPAIGGGTGFVAVCDLAIAAESAVFSFSEVKIGVVPACISPYVVRRVGESRCREFFLTGERLTAQRALESGLVNQVVPEGELDAAVGERVKQLLSSGPYALHVCKQLLQQVPQLDFEEARAYTADVLAKLREGAEAQEGMSAFFEKRKPKWSVD